jgi:hypothetical protein
MSGNDKGFSFRQLFFRDATTGTEAKPLQEKEAGTVKVNVDYMANGAGLPSIGGQEQPLVEDFVQRLQNLINQNNQPGFDFLEFTESLFEEKQNPGPEVYKTVFRIAQKIDKSLTPSRLLDSAIFYKELVQRTADAEINKGVVKKQGLQTEKEAEKGNLDSGLKEARAKIQQLSLQIQELRNQEVGLNNQLVSLDQKYEAKFIDIDRKVSAISNAKEQVIVSIVDIEAGIKSNLS